MSWDGFGDRLAVALRDVTDRVLLVVASDAEPRRFVQFAGSASVLHAQASGPDILADADAAVLADAGWSAPLHSDVHWWIDVPRPALTVEYAALADRCVRALRDALGVDGPEVLRYRAWREPDMQPPGTTWSAERIAELDRGEPELDVPALGLARMR